MSKKEKVMAILFFVLFFVVVGGALLIYKFRDRLPNEFYYVCGIIGFGMMGIIGLVDLIKSIIQYQSRKSKDTVIVKGIIVKHVVRPDCDADGRSWCPVYEYYADGEIRRFQGKLAAGRMGKHALGAEAKIVHNTVTGEAFSLSDAKDIKLINFVFMIMGFGVVAVFVLKLMGRI